MAPQLILNTLVTASAIILSALSFRLIYVTGRFFHLAHAVSITIGGYAAWWLYQSQGFPLAVAVPFAIAASCLIGAISFLLFFRPLMRRGATPMTLLLSSLAVQLVYQHIIALIFGEDAKTIFIGNGLNSFQIAGASVTAVNIGSFIAVYLVLCGFFLTARYTLAGKYIEAVSEHKELSKIFGINVSRVELYAFAIASAIAGLLGVLVGIDLSISPMMGFNWLLYGVVATIVGGIWRVPYIVAAAMALAIAKTTTIWFVGSAWQDVILYSIMFGFFVVRPKFLISFTQTA